MRKVFDASYGDNLKQSAPNQYALVLLHFTIFCHKSYDLQQKVVDFYR